MQFMYATSLRREHALGIGSNRSYVATQSFMHIGSAEILGAAAKADTECLIHQRLGANCVADCTRISGHQHLSYQLFETFDFSDRAREPRVFVEQFLESGDGALVSCG